MLSSALIGCGGIGKLHAKAYRHCSDVRLAAVVDINRTLADDLAREHKVKAYYNVAEAIADRKIDMLDIAAPTKFHAPFAIAAAEAGKHCICEKPLALSESEYQRMAAAFKASGTILGGIFQHRFTDAAIDLERRIRESNFGNILTASCVTNWWRDANYFDPTERRLYATAGGGVLMVQAIHAIDLILHLLGDPVSVCALTAKGGGLPANVTIEHTGAALLWFKNGAIATVSGTIQAWSDLYPRPGEKPDHMAIVEKHRISVTGTLNSVSLETPQGDPEVLFARNIGSFARSARGRVPALVSGESAMRTVRVIQAMYRSAGNGGAPERL